MGLVHKEQVETIDTARVVQLSGSDVDELEALYRLSYPGNWFDPRMLETGCDLVLVIDVQGARQVRRRGIETSAVFVMPPSLDVLEQRLRGRSKDSDQAIAHRLQIARQEVAAFVEYDFLVINDELTAAVDRLRGIVLAERARLTCMRGEAERIVKTFSTVD